MNGEGDKPQSARARLIGAWRYVGTRINGANWDRGANPKGMIYYGPHGEMRCRSPLTSRASARVR